MRGIYSKSSTTGSHSVSFTRTSKPNCSASRSTPAQFPDFNAYLGDATAGMALGFVLNGFENGSGDA